MPDDNVTPFPSKPEPDPTMAAIALANKMADQIIGLANVQRDTGNAVVALHAQVAELTAAVRVLLGALVVAEAAQEQNRNATGRGVPTSESSDPPERLHDARRPIPKEPQT